MEAVVAYVAGVFIERVLGDALMKGLGKLLPYLKPTRRG